MNIKTSTVIVALVFTVVTAIAFDIFGRMEPITTAYTAVDSIDDVTYGWPLTAYEGWAGGIGGVREGEFNVLNTTLDFLIYFAFYILILTTFDLAKSAIKKKK